MMFFSIATLLCLSVSARIRQTDRLPLDVEEWINQANEAEEADLNGSKFDPQIGLEDSHILPSDVQDWVNQINEQKDIEWPSKMEEQDDILPNDGAEWAEQVNGEKWPSKLAVNEADSNSHVYTSLSQGCYNLGASCQQSLHFNTKMLRCTKIQDMDGYGKCACPLYAELALCMITHDASCEDEIRTLKLYKDLEPDCTLLGFPVLPESGGRVASSISELNTEATEKRSDCSIVVSLWKKMGKDTILDPDTVSPTGCCMTSKEHDFDHVRCDEDRVIHIDWRYSHLQGSLPEEIGMLKHLKELYFSDNDLTGPIPASIGDCDSLMYLDLSNNKFSGNIPAEMGKLANLGWLFFWNNTLEGNIPNEFGQLDKLVSFGVSGNPNLNTDVLPGPLQERKDAWKLWLW